MKPFFPLAFLPFYFLLSFTNKNGRSQLASFRIFILCLGVGGKYATTTSFFYSHSSCHYINLYLLLAGGLLFYFSVFRYASDSVLFRTGAAFVNEFPLIMLRFWWTAALVLELGWMGGPGRAGWYVGARANVDIDE